MSTEALSDGATPAQERAGDAVAAAQDPAPGRHGVSDPAKHKSPAFLHSPPDSNNAAKSDASDSELSDLDEEPELPEPPSLAKPDESQSQSEPSSSNPQPEPEPEEDIGEVLPDHWSGAVAVFKPTWHQFKDFNRFMDKVNHYGMKSGIIKIIPPEEWKEKQPPLDELVKHVRVREPIKQDIMGSNGTYRQVNILHGRSYNVPQWRKLCEQSEHQPPARRGERRANADKPRPPRRPAAPKPAEPSSSKKRGKGKAAKKGRGRPGKKDEDERPMTPVSPKPEGSEDNKDAVVDSVEQEQEEVDEQLAAPGRMGARPSKSGAQSVSARRKNARREGSAMIDEAAFKDFDYRMDISDYTPERCEELERAYWKTLTYAAPLYGADMMGTLFDDRTETWNLGKLPNLLDVLGTKIPGVNTAYLYFGMWKATFAWHLEDVDLYSINYVHFGAPKQWYSISQADARRFEAAMKNIWPADAKACSQFLRHKGYLISPQHLLQHYNIKVNKVVSYPGEFVVTFPYGYHSGYNLGYNCAEAVNFALEPWLEMGKIAKRCECAQAQDSVWINVYEIERKLRGEETEYEETDEDEDEDDDEDDEGASGLPSPPASHGVKIKVSSRKRKRVAGDKDEKTKVKKIKLRLKTKAEPPCCLCPNDIPAMDLLPTDDGRKAHRVCALYLPETYIDLVDGKEVVSNTAAIHKDRMDLKCLYCRSKRGACFQCSQKKCARAYHATCAAAAGVFIEEEEVPVFGEDQTEYKEQAFEFSCRFHRTKRDKKLDGATLEDDARIRKHAEALKKGDICQLQYYKGDIFAGVVAENRVDEETLLLDVLPHGDRLEVEWKWLLLADPSDYHLPKASANAIPMPASRKAKDQLNAKRFEDDKPRKEDPFVDGCTWAEFNLHEVDRNKDQAKIDLSKENQMWYYLGKTSTDAKAQYTEDPTKPRHNPKGNYLDTIPKPPKPAPAAPKRQSHPYVYHYSAYSTPGANAARPEKPYVYKPKKPVESNYRFSTFNTQSFSPVGPGTPGTAPAPMPYNNYHHYNTTPNYYGTPTYSTQRFEVKPYQPPQAAPAPSPYHTPQRAQENWNSNPPAHPPQTPSYNSQSPPAPGPAPAQFQPRQPSKVNWQIHPSIYQKYSFFQVHHNRDSSKYRTPYAPWGGFTNGYEGDIRAHLIANQHELLRRSSLNGGSPSNMPPRPTGTPNAYDAAQHQRSASAASPSAQPAHSPGPLPTYQSASPAPQLPAGSPGHQLHPAIRPQYASAVQQSSNQPSQPGQQLQQTPEVQQAQQVQQVQRPANKSKPTPAPKAYKIPPKESPVPLPASFLAAMNSSPAPSALSSKPATPVASAQPSPSSVKPSPVAQLSSPQVKPTNGTSSVGTPAQANAGKVSTTPVPIPKFPGMTPHQAAAKAIASQQLHSMMAQSQDHATGTSSATIEPARGQTSSLAKSHMAGASSGTNDVAMTDTPGLSAVAPQSDNVPTNGTQEFPDVPGSESMQFMEKMMENLRRAGRC